MNHPADTESLLCTAYEQQAQRYQAALDRLKQVGAAGQPIPEPCLQEVVSLLNEVAAIDAGLLATRQAWQQEGRRPGPALEAVLANLCRVLEALLDEVARVEQHLRKQRDQLLPEVESLCRGLQMRRAYGQCGAVGSEE